ncbi:MAG: lycopene cyclase family protein, partial [Candidatus Puniceispirillum sp.]
MLAETASSFTAGTSDNEIAHKHIAIIGAGCASLSLAARVSELPSTNLHIIEPPYPVQADHVWGFWAMEWLDRVRPLVRKSWHKWAVITEHANTVMQSADHPYQAISRH